MGETLTFRTPMARVLTIALLAVAVIAMAYAVSEDGLIELWRSGPTVLLAAVVVWVLFWRPQVEVSDGGITIVNIVRTVHVPWPAFSGVDSRWSLTVTAGTHQVSAWAVPAGSGMAARSRRVGARGMAKEGRGPAQSSGSAEAAALAIGERHEALVDAGHLSGSSLGSPQVQTSWNKPEVVALAASAALALASLLLP